VLAGVLLDLFGTVVAPFSRERHNRALTLAAEALGLDPTRCLSAWEADYDNRVRGRSGDIAAQLLAIADAQDIKVNAEQLGPITASYAAFCDEAMQPVPSAASTLLALAERSVPLGLVSNTAPDLAAAFDRSSLRALFTTCTFSCAIDAAKPDRAIYAAAAQSLGVEPALLLFVGDGSDDELAGAARTGLTAALVEAETTDTYDPGRHAVDNWAGTRLRRLSDVLDLVP
jgi:putative hydrolase of the HAD superfamily